MSTHTYAVPSALVLDAQSAAASVRTPTTVAYAADTLTLTYAPDLDAPTAALVDAAVADVLARERALVDLTSGDYAAIKPHLAVGRRMLAQSRAEFMAKTATERDRELFESDQAKWRVIFRLLRD